MKRILMRIIDVFMFVLMFLLMAFYLTGQQIHEILGTIMFICFIIHHILNGKWHKNILKGNYKASRQMITFINIVLFIDIVCLGMSGILMSEFVFDFIPSFGLISLARRIHMVAAYWEFVLMSVHLGFHWQMIQTLIKKKLKDKFKYIQLFLFQIFPIILCVTGLYFFIKNKIYNYMFLVENFVFFDYEIHFIDFIFQYMLISSLCITIGYTVLKKSRERNKC